MNAFRHWRAVRAVERELQSLGDDELDDLGIGRWRIAQIARTGSGGASH
jgi:uncharacterized protein YjiS (DUF1127 family)